MQGKQVVITGATDGIGKVTARLLMSKGARVTIISRNKEKLAGVADELAQATGGNKPLTLAADLSVPADVKRVASEVAAAHPVIDVLVNNAGAYFAERELNSVGLEKTFALNHLNYFLLTHCLIPNLKKSTSARIVSVSSDAHYGCELDFEDLFGEKNYKGWRAYQRSKLANVLFTRELAERLKSSGITANCLHPGFVASKFGHNNQGWLNSLIKLGQSLFAITPEKGAETSVFLASAPEVAKVTGRYFSNCREKEVSRFAQDPTHQKRLWAESEKILAAYL